MADLSDVENALVTLIAGALFPPGYLPGSTTISLPLNGNAWPIKLYRGWPEQQAIELDLFNGAAHVSVFPEAAMSAPVSHFLSPPTVQGATVACPIAISPTGAVVTLTGTSAAGVVIGIAMPGPTIARSASAYAFTASDTLATAAAHLAALIVGATSSGPSITLPVPPKQVGAMIPQPATTTVRWQIQRFRVSCWCPTPAARDAIVGAIDNAIASLGVLAGRPTTWISLTATDAGKIMSAGGHTDDMPSRDRIWRRDLLYTVEYPTSLTQSLPTVLFPGLTLTGGNGPATPQGTQPAALEPFGNVIAMRSNVLTVNGSVLVMPAQPIVSAPVLVAGQPIAVNGNVLAFPYAAYARFPITVHGAPILFAGSDLEMAA